LVNAIANTYSHGFNRKLQPLEDIVVTAGATEGILISLLSPFSPPLFSILSLPPPHSNCLLLALFAAIQTFIEPGDEAILFEPFYDSYPAAIGIFLHILADFNF
jgi:aspartate/methionine/tyrosine aminotransferase